MKKEKKKRKKRTGLNEKEREPFCQGKGKKLFVKATSTEVGVKPKFVIH